MTDDNAMGPFTMKDYQQWTPTVAVYPEEKELEYLIAALASEAGEVAGKYAKYIRASKDANYFTFAQSVHDELGDLLWNISQLLNHFGWSFEDIAEGNVRKLMDRVSRGVIQGDGDNR